MQGGCRMDLDGELVAFGDGYLEQGYEGDVGEVAV
jgi:hypothetical protein